MKQIVAVVEKNRLLARDTYEMTLSGDFCAVTTPGQFVDVKLDGYFLRRPISVCDCRDGRLVLIYKVVGSGTETMSRMNTGEKLDLLTGLGNGFDTAPSGNEPLLIGGGAGVPPLYWLARRLTEEGKNPRVILGFRTSDDVFYEKEFRALAVPVTVATENGSYGVKGFVTDAMTAVSYSYYYACGPMPMFRAVHDTARTEGQMSFEERMGCGFGACMGCSCRTLTGSKRLCKDGPVLLSKEVLWQTQE
ncbi:MAG: dihydroorotate dehydrogenase electron transfer subunit [Eubacteriales bacterium]|nr:dihydroorotate dehydrogenase electron transfer subunit [Eubacteriales bacterium]